MNIFEFIGTVFQILIDIFTKTGKGVANYADAFAITGEMAKNATEAMSLEQRKKILEDFDFDDEGKLIVKKGDKTVKKSS